MQTFLPSPNFTQSAEFLDFQRLGKQRVEALQILTALTNPSYGWQNHPAVKMWRDSEYALARYGLAICNEWTTRGYKDTCHQKICALFDFAIPFQAPPPWLTSEFCSNHRSILLAKNPEWYGQFNWSESPAIKNEKGQWPYLWPK